MCEHMNVEDLIHSWAHDLPAAVEAIQPLLALMRAAEHGIISSLAMAPMEAMEIEQRYGRSGRDLLDVLCGLSIAARSASGHYSLTEDGDYSLARGHVRELEAFLRHKRRVYQSMLCNPGRLEGAIAPTEIPGIGEGEDYVRAMHFTALRRNMVLPGSLGLAGCQTIIDAGCGSGYYTHRLLSASESAGATLVDYAEVLEVAGEYTALAGLQKRVSMVACDLLSAPLPVATAHDTALLFSVMHQYGFEENVTLLRNLRGVLTDQARLVVCDYISPAPHRGSVDAAFSLLMRAATPCGQTYTFHELRAIMREAGFTVVDAIASGVDDLTFVACDCTK
jgi:SAM-dependent methyltransferase